MELAKWVSRFLGFAVAVPLRLDLVESGLNQLGRGLEVIHSRSFVESVHSFSEQGLTQGQWLVRLPLGRRPKSPAHRLGSNLQILVRQWRWSD